MIKLIIFAIAFSVIALSRSPAQSLDNRAPDTISQIDTYVLSEMKENKIPGLVYGIFYEDSLLLSKAYGLADIQNQSPVRLETVFELASITKPFTAAAILILQDDGKLDIDDPIKKYFPESPDSWSEITLKHLLTHTSGLAGPDDWPGINRMKAERVRKEYASWSKQFLIDALIAHEPGYLPGEIFYYSDPGYALLGIVIDNITGSYREFIEKRIFMPLEMNSTYFLDKKSVHPFEARGYTLRNGEIINIRRYHDIEIPSWYGIFSNVEDLQKWDAALNKNTILTESSKNIMWTEYHTNNGKPTGYGLGWYINQLGGYKIVQHSGRTGTQWLKIPEKGYSVVTLTNLGYGGYDPVEFRRIAYGIANILGFNTQIDSNYITNTGSKIKSINESIKRKLIGSYTLTTESGNGSARIFEENGKVYLSAMGFNFELGLLEDGSLIQMGLPFEYILTPSDNSYQKLTSRTHGDVLTKNK